MFKVSGKYVDSILIVIRDLEKKHLTIGTSDTDLLASYAKDKAVLNKNFIIAAVNAQYLQFSDKNVDKRGLQQLMKKLNDAEDCIMCQLCSKDNYATMSTDQKEQHEGLKDTIDHLFCCKNEEAEHHVVKII